MSFNCRLGICQICKKLEAKYTCPACEVVTCSLSCVKEHKKINECEGIRSKTAFVRLKQFNDLHILSDYRLLEEAGRVVDRSRRDLRRRPLPGAHVPYKLQKLKLALLRRGTRLHFLPLKFHRHDSNTTHWNNNTNIIFWKVQLTFLNASNLTLSMKSCSENTVLEDIVEQYLSNSITIPEKARKSLKAYRHAGVPSIDVLLKTEKVSYSQKKFYQLDLKKTLKANFIGKDIVEFPQLYLVIKGFYSTAGDNSIDNQKKTKVMNYLTNTEAIEGDSDSDTIANDDKEEIDDSFTPNYKDLLVA